MRKTQVKVITILLVTVLAVLIVPQLLLSFYVSQKEISKDEECRRRLSSLEVIPLNGDFKKHDFYSDLSLVLEIGELEAKDGDVWTSEIQCRFIQKYTISLYKQDIKLYTFNYSVGVKIQNNSLSILDDIGQTYANFQYTKFGNIHIIQQLQHRRQPPLLSTDNGNSWQIVNLHSDQASKLYLGRDDDLSKVIVFVKQDSGRILITFESNRLNENGQRKTVTYPFELTNDKWELLVKK